MDMDVDVDESASGLGLGAGESEGEGWRIVSSDPSTARVVLAHSRHGEKPKQLSVCLDYTTHDVLTTQCLMVRPPSLSLLPSSHTLRRK